MFIDPHVHCRDGKQSHKETIAHALQVAEKAGFTAIFDMPNVDPPVTTEQQALERIALAKGSPVFYGIHLALTADKEQVKRAVEAHRKVKNIVGFKLYAGHSVGNIGVVHYADQDMIYKTLAKEGYEGVLVVHCEKEEFLKKDWDPKNPRSHAEARPWIAELESAKDQADLAYLNDFRGTLHIAHISVPDAVELTHDERSFRMTCGVTPHHLLLDYTAMDKPDGLVMKMNPPLRSPDMREKMFELFKKGKITWIETDHAPHTLAEKLGPPYMSGITGLQAYPTFIEWLKQQGFREEQIKDLTFRNIAKTYGLDLEPRKCVPLIGLRRLFDDHYTFNPYKGFVSFLD